MKKTPMNISRIKKRINALVKIRNEGFLINSSNKNTPEKYPYIRFVIGGNLPQIKKYTTPLTAAVCASHIVTNKITRGVLADPSLREIYVKPFVSRHVYDYCIRYIKIHGLEIQNPPMTRPDLLLTKTEKLKLIEINADGPDGYTFTNTLNQILSLLETKKHSNVQEFFHHAQKNFLEHTIKKTDNKKIKVVIPYWLDGNPSPLDADRMAHDLKKAGHDAEAKEIHELKHGNSARYTCVIRTIGIGGKTFSKNKRAPLFTDPAYLALPQYPPPWLMIAGLKHWLSLIYQMTLNPSLGARFGVSKKEISTIKNIVLPTFAPPFYRTEEITQLFLNNSPEHWVTKKILSTYGENYHDTAPEMNHNLRLGNTVLQKKVDCYRSDELAILDVDGKIKKHKEWFVDIGPMGIVPKNKMIALGRVCPKHPMNVSGKNGGALYNPLA